MIYTVKMQYFDSDHNRYGVMEGKFPHFSLAWKMVNMLNVNKFYKMLLTEEDDENEYYKRTDVTYTTYDGARRALKRAPKDSKGNRRLVLNASWGPDDDNDETHVLIIMKAEPDGDL